MYGRYGSLWNSGLAFLVRYRRSPSYHYHEAPLDVSGNCFAGLDGNAVVVAADINMVLQ